MESVLKELQKEYDGKAIVKIADVEENKENYNLAVKYRVRVVPTIVFVNADGSTFRRIEGARKKEELKAIFKEMGVE